MMFEASGRFAMRRALAAARARAVAPMVQTIQQNGSRSFAEIARELNAHGSKAPRGGPWSGKQVERLLKRLVP